MVSASISFRRFRIAFAGPARQRHRRELMGAAENVVLVGGPGTGKSHGATAFGAQGIELHWKRYVSSRQL